MTGYSLNEVKEDFPNQIKLLVAWILPVSLMCWGIWQTAAKVPALFQ